MLDPHVQNRFDEIVALTDSVCHEVLSDEYAALAREAALLLAQQPETPLLRGKAAGWACGIVRAVGHVNFLADPASTPHLRTDALAPLFGVSEATAANRDRNVREHLDLVRMDPHWTLPSRLADNLMVWMLLFNGIPTDVRALPLEAQRSLAAAGYIPFAPADPDARLPHPRWREPADATSAGEAFAAGDLDPDAPRLRLRIALDAVEPEVWREVEVPADLPLDALHHVIQAAMGWENAHLHTFETRTGYWGPPLPFGGEWDDERSVTVAAVLPRKRSRLTYTYDLGDGWTHTITRMETLASDPTGPRFACTGGARACPPEDCGGPWGYTDLRLVLADPRHPEHKEATAWLGAPFDPDAFALADTNARLQDIVQRQAGRG